MVITVEIIKNENMQNRKTIEKILEQMNDKIRKLENAQWWEIFQKLIFPPVCGICGKLNNNYLCNKCNFELQKEAQLKIDTYVTEIGFQRKHFDEHIYFFRYQGLIRQQIINYKFNNEAYKYKAISNFILKNFILKDIMAFQLLNDYEVIVPVPISKKRFKERGYNQAELIAKQISKALEKRIVTNCLYKSKNIVAQSTLNKQEREENIKNVYTIKNQNILLNKKVLLVDDIYTTGSTANECCKILLKAKPNKIGVMTLAKD